MSKRIEYTGTLESFSMYVGEKQFHFKPGHPQELDDAVAAPFLKRADFKVSEPAKAAPAAPAKKADE